MGRGFFLGEHMKREREREREREGERGRERGTLSEKKNRGWVRTELRTIKERGLGCQGSV